MVNGIIGFVVAASTNLDDAKRRLDAEAANAILEKIYGTKTWKQWSNR